MYYLLSQIFVVHKYVSLLQQCHNMIAIQQLKELNRTFFGMVNAGCGSLVAELIYPVISYLDITMVKETRYIEKKVSL